jgi:predicted NodU family carbamoyl transferase
LRRAGLRYVKADHDRKAWLIVDELLAGRAISLFLGCFAWGPRAQGNRSILADFGRPGMKDIVNTPQNALSAFSKSGMNTLYLVNDIVRKG